MRSWRKVAQIWMSGWAAVMLLVVGTPHFECHCVHDRIRPFCLALLLPGGSEGRDRSCCPVSERLAAPQQNAAPGSCCRQSPRVSLPARDAGQVQCAGCQKKLADAPFATPVPEPTPAPRDLTLGVLVFTTPEAPSQLPGVAIGLRFPHCRSGPLSSAERSALLQRYLL
jgi:hypothetical protein